MDRTGSGGRVMAASPSDRDLAGLCRSGLMRHKWQRVVGKDRSGDLWCPSCRQAYDPTVFGPDEPPLTVCPRCKGALGQRTVWHRVCVRCGETG